MAFRSLSRGDSLFPAFKSSGRLIELDAGVDIEETPEMLAAIDAGIRSMETGLGVPLEEARQRIARWIMR